MTTKTIFVPTEYEQRFVSCLKDAIAKKKAVNPRYSLRAFAQLLQLDQSLLSKVLHGKKGLSPVTMVRILRQLSADPKTISEFVRYERSQIQYNEVSDDTFIALADWRPFAILELSHLPGFEMTVKNIGAKLRMGTEDVEECLARLEKLGYVERVGEEYRVLSPSNSWASVQTKDVRRSFQRGVLQKALETLDSVDGELVDFSSCLITMRKSDVPEFRHIIKETRRKLIELFRRSPENHDEVYQLSIALYPVTKT